jgi:hypothetical protein
MATSAGAQEIEPRAYSNTPVGLNFLVAGYGYSEGDVITDSGGPLQDAKIRVHTAVLAYVRALDIWGKSGKLEVILPHAWVSGTATFRGQTVEREVSGFADPRVRFSVNLYGAPALTMAEFANYKQDLIIGASLLVIAPLGQYEDDKLVNIGTNRWSVKPEVGISKTWGPVTVELAAGVTFYTRNDDFLGDKTLEREPMFSLQGHLVYHFPRGMWGALDVVGYGGGRTTVDGVKDDDLQQNVRVGLTLAFPIDRHNSIRVYGSTGAFARTGSNLHSGGVAWQFRWGGGL